MLQHKARIISWGIGLSNGQAELLRRFLGEGRELILHPDVASAANMSDKGPAPYVVWISAACCRDMSRLPEALSSYGYPAEIVMLLDAVYGPKDFDRACDYGIKEVLRPPLDVERVSAIMLRAVESRAARLASDRFTEALLLERKTLRRKTLALGFLTDFLAAVGQNLNTGDLLQNAFAHLGKLLPVHSAHAALVETGAGGEKTLSLYVGLKENSADFAVCRDLLEEHVAAAVPGATYRTGKIRALPLSNAATPDRPAGTAAPLCLPLVAGGASLGCLLLLTDAAHVLDRDRASALDFAVRHLALSLRNAEQFAAMRMRAEYDVLTGICNRRHFEELLGDEMQRLSRHGRPLSVLMADVDHFKRVNDTWGHRTGDAVLREVAALLTGGIRSTDCCARYGGEEFVILLPYTDADEAASLAERIRIRTAEHVFTAEGGVPLRLTISFGVSGIGPTETLSREELLSAADGALYAAKRQGRNRTCRARAAFRAATRKAG
ncbi:MAG: GGDEF domain-containing protein [Desulfovibrio sp.]|jgi:diguanylate cyclase (GGDEF)-like protein|nr:GGDEF domain-containing protein [Desulfovibrio sp.]